jgi:excinuclease UvrABC nuclease subunit
MDYGQSEHRAKFTLYVNERTRSTLETLQEQMNASSLSETIRRAAEFALWATQTQAQGGRMFTEDAEGKVEVVRV